MKSEAMDIFIHHDRDMDGLACAAVAKHFLPAVEIKGWDYSYDPKELIEYAVSRQYDRIFMADVSLPMNDMIELSKCCTKFIWIDHHKSAIDAFTDLGDQAIEYLMVGGWETYLQVGFSACELTYVALGKVASIGDVPAVIQLLGIYDTWRKDDPKWNWDDHVLPFQVAMNVEFSIDVIIRMIETRMEPHDIIRIGKSMLQFERSEMEKAVYGGARLQEDWDVSNAVTINASFNPGRMADIIWAVFPEAKIMVQYYRLDDGRWKYSLRSPKGGHDCAEIAKQFGGGGHFHAAGFTLNNLIF